ncbi:MAG: guanylate kinase [Prevotellaceae bacterium]|jgi:guanylate kinase|nr:guanylate kinase [Prevotellaceae bacterium]
MAGKLIIFSAPSGAGKSTLVRHLLDKGFELEFSISATSRAPRGCECHGHEYYFMSADEFKDRIAGDEFLEYEEVYSDCFYGTLKCEVERILSTGKNVIFDVDVIGGLNIKKQYGDNALAVFIAPPSLRELEKRLASRATDSPEMIERRIGKAEFEMSFKEKFDVVVVNDRLHRSQVEVEKVVRDFLTA